MVSAVARVANCVLNTRLRNFDRFTSIQYTRYCDFRINP